jgi:16S rRNA (guanine966-N2)-methyltransferase
LSIKILGGFARGQLLLVPKGDLIRPTSVMLKRRIFDFYQDLSGYHFVDLCAGSGAVGLEAWSRGAKKVFLNEPHRHVIKILSENRESCLLKNHHRKIGDIETSNMTAEKFITLFKEHYLLYSDNDQKKTIIFLDPPYNEKKIYIDIVDYLKEGGWFFGEIWIESDRLKGVPFSNWNDSGLMAKKLYEQGDSYVFVGTIPTTN